MEEKNKSYKLVIIIIITIIVSMGLTYAYFIWNSTSNTDISLTSKGVIVELEDGKDIKGANLIPTNSYLSKDSIKKDIRIRLKNMPKDEVVVTFNLNINSIDSGLNDSSFKYILVKDSTVIKEGNFANSKNGDSILLTSINSSDGSLSTDISNYTLYIYIDGESGNNPSSMMNKSFDFSIDITGTNSSKSGFPVNFVEELDDGTKGNSGSGVYKVKHDAIAGSNSATGSTIPATTDYRYYGASPNNYICLDMEGSNTCPDKHLYRIIGSIYEEISGQNLLKVIKATQLTDGSITEYSWDYKVDDNSNNNIWASITSGNYSNSLTSGSTLMILLNSGLWWNGTKGNYYNNSDVPKVVNYANYKLSDKAKSYINTSRYYLGGGNSNVTTNNIYSYERGTNRYNSDRPLYWDGNIGLMYASDYGYAAGNSCATGTLLGKYNENCKNNDWLFSGRTEWLMTSNSTSSTAVFDLYSTGFIVFSRNSSGSLPLRPVFYLKSNITKIGGTGTSTDPYIIN